LGRPSHINVKSTTGGLEVRADGKVCFSTDKINLPTGYNFGMTAVSSDPPDSFEVFAFTLTSAQPTESLQHHQQQQQQQQQVQQSQPQGETRQDIPTNSMPRTSDDRDASIYTTSEAQFTDLQNRLNLLSKSITNLFAEIQRHTAAEESRYQEILSKLPNGQIINQLDGRVANLDRMIGNLERELKTSDHKTQFAKLSDQIAQTHIGVTEHVPARLKEYVQAHTPRIGFILYSFMAFQTCCFGVWAWFKWRKSTMPKKYL
jgi:mannose-binding lectin 1